MERLVMAYNAPRHGGYLRKIVPYLKRHGRRVEVQQSVSKRGHIVEDYVWLLHKQYDDATIVLWDGVNEKHIVAVTELRKQRPPEQARLVFAESGWLPGASVGGAGKTLYLDRQGVNALSGIRQFTPPVCTKAMKRRLRAAQVALWPKAASDDAKKTEPYTFIPLQLPKDTNIKVGSPHFKDMQHLIDFVEKTIPGRLVFKRHPRDKLSYTVSGANSMLLTSGDLGQVLAGAQQVIGINSTVLLEALDFGLKVAALGVSLFTGHEVMLECHTDIKRLAQFETWVPNQARIDALLYELRFRRQVWLPNPQQSLSENRILQELDW